MLVFFQIYLMSFDDVRYMNGDVSIDYKDTCNDFINPNTICRLDFLEAFK